MGTAVLYESLAGGKRSSENAARRARQAAAGCRWQGRQGTGVTDTSVKHDPPTAPHPAPGHSRRSLADERVRGVCPAVRATS